MTSLVSRAVAFRNLQSATTKCRAPCNSAFHLLPWTMPSLSCAQNGALLVPLGSDCCVRRLLSTTAAVPSAANQSPCLPTTDSLPLPPSHNRVLKSYHQTARRSFWQEVVRERVDPDTGEVVWSEGARAAGARAERAESSERIDDRHKRYMYYEKPTSRKRRMAEAVQYRAKKTKVMELVRYIKFREQADGQGDQGQKGKGR